MRLGLKKKIGVVIGLLIVMTISFIIYCNRSINVNAEGLTYYSVKAIPYNKVGLVLGTSKYLTSGGINPYFLYRIEAAVNLYNSGKVEVLLVSGDNAHRSYNEPIQFQKELVKLGVPESCIVLDYAGFSTLDSVIRANEVFGQESFTIISQQFHNERAIFIAKHHHLKTIGFNARDVGGSNGLKVQLREYLARSKAVLDIFFGRQPKFLGEPIQIE